MTTRHFVIFLRFVTAAMFVAVGTLHFLRPGPFVAIVPPYIPMPALMVFVSGAFEILGGLGLLLPSTRKVAGWGLIALLVVVFQANIYMLVDHVYLANMPHEEWLLWARLPLQAVFVAMVWGSMRPSQPMKLAVDDDEAFTENTTNRL